MTSLARIEVQSVMQFLERGDLSRLARSSRRMHADADEKLVWRHVDSTLRVSQAVLDRGLAEAIRRGGGLALRHQPPSRVDIEAEPRHLESIFAAVRPILGSVVDLTLAIVIDWCKRDLSPDALTIEQYNAIVDQLPLSNLTRLHIASPDCSALYATMASRLPRMTRLQSLVVCIGTTSSAVHVEAAHAICTLPHLSQLLLSLPRCAVVGDGVSMLMALVGCAHLIDLTISTAASSSDSSPNRRAPRS